MLFCSSSVWACQRLRKHSDSEQNRASVFVLKRTHSVCLHFSKLSEHSVSTLKSHVRLLLSLASRTSFVLPFKNKNPLCFFNNWCWSFSLVVKSQKTQICPTTMKTQGHFPLCLVKMVLKHTVYIYTHTTVDKFELTDLLLF